VHRDLDGRQTFPAKRRRDMSKNEGKPLHSIVGINTCPMNPR
jgi:hypothetical protein